MYAGSATTGAASMETSPDSTPTENRPLTNFRKMCPFHNRRPEPPRSNRNLERTIQCLQADIQRLIQRYNPRAIRPNISAYKELTSIRALRDLDDVTITRSDKRRRNRHHKDLRTQQALLRAPRRRFYIQTTRAQPN